MQQKIVNPWASWAVLVLSFGLLVGCSRTATWEEEVPLNTGETIWIKRSMPWVYKGGFGNPFAMSMLPTREQTIRFMYSGSEYSYTGRANIHWIAISPETKRPVLVAPAVDFGWYTDNTYFCVIPYYVQLVPDATGLHWTWPEKIEPWLYELPANVMGNAPRLEEQRKERYTANDRDQRDQTSRRESSHRSRVDPLYKASTCISNYKPSVNPNLDGDKK
ncbi:MAG: hypothetical protein Q8R72_12175 [Hylemonella sp.]|nr:hypothetical protein [Hylemonella sp.]